MKHLISIILLLTVTCAMAQKKKDAEKPVEPQIGTLEAAWKPVIIEHYFGLRGGYGMGNGRFEPTRQMASYSGLLNFGLFYRFDVPAQKYVGCVEVDLGVMEKGFKYETFNESGVMYSRKYTVIELPILWQPYLPLSSKNGSSRIYLSAGPFLNYAFRSEHRTYDKKTNETIEAGDYNYLIARDNNFEYGITAGAGVQIGIRKFMFAAEFRYNIMLSNVLKGVQKYPGNPFFSPVDHMNISISLGYRLFNKNKANKNESE